VAFGRRPIKLEVLDADFLVVYKSSEVTCSDPKEKSPSGPKNVNFGRMVRS
jgi:hypothetical protein